MHVAALHAQRMPTRTIYILLERTQTFTIAAHNHTQNPAAVTGAQPIEVRSASTCLVSHTACRLSRSTSAAGAASVSARRRSPVSTADTTARGVAASRARVKKKGQNYHFFLTHSNGKRRPVAGVGGTKIFWGRVEKKDKIFPPPPHSPPPNKSMVPHVTCCLQAGDKIR